MQEMSLLCNVHLVHGCWCQRVMGVPGLAELVAAQGVQVWRTEDSA